MADKDLDAELLALAGDDESGSDTDDGKPTSSVKKSPSEQPTSAQIQSSPPKAENPTPQSVTNGVTKRKAPTKMVKAGNTKRAKNESDDEVRA